jgi:hypothetical protein
MSQVTASSVITNTLTSGGNTISIPKNVTVSGNIDFAGNLLQNGGCGKILMIILFLVKKENFIKILNP